MRLLPLVLLLTCLSCEDKGPHKKSSPFFEKELLSIYKFHEVNNKIVNSDELKMAPGTEVQALRLSVYGNHFERADYCLLVRRPQGLDPGLLRFVLANDFDRPCEEHLFEPSASRELEFYNLSIELGEKGRESEGLTLKVDDKSFHYPVFNGNNEWGVSISPHEMTTKKNAKTLSDGTLCHEIKDDCSASEDKCSDCANGSYYFKTSSCSTQISRVCGRDECGHRGRPACIRGEVSTGVSTYCIQDSPVGFCIGDARVACLNGRLICE